MYCPPPQKLEDELLNLYGEVPLVRREGDEYARVTGYREGLSAAVLLYCCLDYAHPRTSIKVSQCAYGEGSPGMVFGLSAPQLLEALGQAVAHQPALTLSNSLDGSYQLSWTQPVPLLQQSVWQSIAKGERWTQRVYF